MRASNSFPPHRIEDALTREDLRRRMADRCVFDQDPRQLRGLVDRPGRRQPEPSGILLLLLGRHAAAFDGAQVFKRERDRAVEVCDYGIRFLHLLPHFVLILQT
jgi:hypothetical protein